MNVSEKIGYLIRKSIEPRALEEVCACWYYDLADSIEATDTIDLIDIINHNYDCDECGYRKES